MSFSLQPRGYSDTGYPIHLSLSVSLSLYLSLSVCLSLFLCNQADALTLGTHYEYDAKKIKQFYGQISKYYTHTSLI